MRGTRIIAIACTAFTLLMILSTEVLSQGEQNTDWNPDQVLKSNARVNPSTLAMEMSIPLGTYPGRAGNSLSNLLNYSSKVWQLHEFEAGVFVNPSGSQGIGVVPFYARGSAGGWTSTLAAPRIDYPDELPYYMAGYGVDEGTIWSNIFYGEEIRFTIYYMKRLHVVMPDGSTHEFRASDTPIPCGGETAPCNDVDLTGEYLSVDGSRMRLAVTTTGATLFMPDGSRMLFGASNGSVLGQVATSVIDAHGNKLTYDNTAREWTDTMGRVLPNPLPDNLTTFGFYNHHQEQTVGDQIVSLPGLGPETVETTWSWRNLKHPSSSDPDDSGLGNISLDLAYPADFYCDGSHFYSFTGTKLFFNNNAANVRICNYFGTGSPGTAFNPVVLTKITLANGQSYQFKYNLYGEIEKIIYPTGGYERFVYAQITSLQNPTQPYEQINRGVIDRYVSEKGDGSDEIHWTYSASRSYSNPPIGQTDPYKVTITNPDGTKTEQLIHDEPGYDSPRPFGFDNAKTGRPYEERVYSSDSTPALLARTLTAYETTGPLSGGYSVATRDLRPVKVISITFEPGNGDALATMTETVYDTMGNSDPAYFSSANRRQTKKYNFVAVSASTATSANIATATGWFSTSNLTSTTEMDYLYDANYKARNITGLVTETRVKDASGNVKSKTQISYDESSHALSSLGAMPTAAANSWADPTVELGSNAGSKRGLPTTIRSYSDIGANQYIETHRFYDQFGNVRKVRDGRGNDTETMYDDDYAFAYPTRTISSDPDATGPMTPLETTVFYDFNTGLQKSTTDANGLETRIEYNDLLLRPTRVTTYHNNQQVGGEAITEYGAGTSASTRFVKTRSQIDETNWKESYTWYDGLGRTIKGQSVDSDGDVFVETEYDNMGRAYKVTNPYRNQETVYWSETVFDSAGRPWKTITPDNAFVETTYSIATSGGNIGTAVTVKDQAGKLRRSITNALGHLTRVDEPDANGNLGTVSAPVQPTNYAYDALNNLMQVIQGVQTRSFAYDSLSRLSSATNPESGTIQYVYDNFSNLTRKTDARGVQTDYVYDALNRVTNRNYSTPGGAPPNYQPTPNVSYFYDGVNVAGGIPFSKGKLTKVESSVSTTEYTGFDILGRVTASKQTTDGTDYISGYEYNLSGALIEQQYPSGRKVQNTLDQNGDLSLVQSGKCLDANPSTNATCTNRAGLWSYASSFTYNAAGAMTSMQLGNGRWESTTFNSRLQPTQIALGVTAGATNLLDLDYTYGTTQNNGNVLSQTITVPSVGITNGFTAVQNYSYDSLNRLKDATENITPNGGSQTQSWKQTFLFDRYGNRNFDEANTTFAGFDKLCNSNTELCADLRKKLNPAINASDNRLSSGQGYSFDTSGNTTRDAGDRKFTYDAENKQVKVESLSPGTDTVTGTIGEYWYDGDGRRVKKYVPSTDETTVFVYDAGSKLVAEYSTIVASSNDAEVAYLTNDHLGSPRINTDANGAVIARHDYHPFGEEIATSQRVPGLGYADDEVRKQFTGYERDGETDLDFAQARYHSYNLARFNSPDPMLASAIPGNPQSFNRFAYALNNPMLFTDPTGFSTCPPRCTNGQRVVTDDGIEGTMQSGLGTGLLASVEVRGSDDSIIPIETSHVQLSLSVEGRPSIGPATLPATNPFISRPETTTDGSWRIGPDLGLVGVSVGGAAGLGLGDGVGVDGSLNYGFNSNDTTGFGGFTTYGIGSSTHTGDPTQNFSGISGGVGFGAFWSNAGSFHDLGGPFESTIIATPVGSLQMDTSGDIRVITISPGGVGAGIYNFNTTTPRTVETMANPIPRNPARVYPQ